MEWLEVIYLSSFSYDKVWYLIFGADLDVPPPIFEHFGRRRSQTQVVSSLRSTWMHLHYGYDNACRIRRLVKVHLLLSIVLIPRRKPCLTGQSPCLIGLLQLTEIGMHCSPENVDGNIEILDERLRINAKLKTAKQMHALATVYRGKSMFRIFNLLRCCQPTQLFSFLEPYPESLKRGSMRTYSCFLPRQNMVFSGPVTVPRKSNRRRI